MKRVAAAALALFAVAAPAGAGSLPDWLVAAAARPLPQGSERFGAAVLHDEQIVQVPADGRITTVTRWVVRVQSREGASAAALSAEYVRGESEVRSLRAWRLGPTGEVLKVWNRKDAADEAVISEGQLYSEVRRLRFFDPDIRPGQLFACEYVTVEEPLFTQWAWYFQGPEPRALSRLQLDLPEGLELRVVGEHIDSAATSHERGRWTWEMRNVPALPREPMVPDATRLGVSVFVQAVAPGSDRSPAGLAFTDWRAASRWLLQLSASQSEVTPEIAARARAITGATADTLDRIRALTRFVQTFNYVSMDLNVARGFGYRPHAAASVLAAGYGDCKDKANLLCTLLHAAGERAWLLAVSGTGRDRVDSSIVWLGQFDHCITAIHVPVSYRGPLLDEGRHGRLAAFDPTDPLTAFGDLPEPEQGGFGLLEREGDGDLVRLPTLGPESNRLERTVDATLEATGALEAHLTERSVGQAATAERALRRRTSASEYQRALEEWLPAQGGAVQIRAVDSHVDSLAGRYRLDVDYVSPAFARLVANRMLTFRGALLTPREPWTALDTARTLPIAILAECVDESLRVALPEGWALDERPPDVHVANDLGRLDAAWLEDAGSLTLVRRWLLHPRTVEARRWKDLCALFMAYRATTEATVVVVRR